MKTKYFKIASLALVVFFVNCSKDDNPAPSTPIPVVTDAEMETDMKTDLAIDEAYEPIYASFQSSIAGKGTSISDISLKLSGTCAVEPVTKANDTYNSLVYISLTYDYGTAGCTLSNGATVKGMVTLYYRADKPIVFKFTNYEYNGKMINGTVAFSKTASGTNQAKITNTQSLTVNFPVLGEFKRVGSITRTYVKGYDTKDDYTDDIFNTTGGWTTTFPDKTTNVVTITKELVTDLSCSIKKHKSGTIQFTRKSNVATIDFGDGLGCNVKWTITRNGQSKEISRE